MRAIKLSKSFWLDLERLLDQGMAKFGPHVVESKSQLIRRTITQHLCRHPVRPVDPDLGICAYPVSKTPFVLLYDYDDAELRVHLVIHARADRTKIDLATVEW